MQRVIRGALIAMMVMALIGAFGRAEPSRAAVSAIGPVAQRDAAQGAAPDGAGSALAALADRIVRTAEESHYTHKTVIDAERGIYDADCSAFVGYLLKQVAPSAFDAVPVEKGGSRPRAFKYAQLFESLGRGARVAGWSAVPRLADARPGDVIAWSNLPLRPGEDTGHVMVVADVPVVNADGSVRVRVIDSTGTPHAADTRVGGKTGVGSGVIAFQIDDAGAPVSFQFAPGRSFHAKPISIGRVVSERVVSGQWSVTHLTDH